MVCFSLKYSWSFLSNPTEINKFKAACFFCLFVCFISIESVAVLNEGNNCGAGSHLTRRRDLSPRTGNQSTNTFRNKELLYVNKASNLAI